MSDIRIGIQLFGLRAYDDFAAGIAKAAELGYRYAEPFGWKPPVPTVEHFALCARRGIRCPSAHLLESQAFGDPDERDALIAALVEHRARAWTFPGLGGDDESTIRATAAKVEAFYQEHLAPAGLGVEYHNHDSDMLPSYGGRSKLDLMLAAAPSLRWQPDIGNFFLAGCTDAVATLDRYRGRVGALHLKDIRRDHSTSTGPKSAIALGEGVVEVGPAVAWAVANGVVDLIVEQEGFASNADCDRMLERSLAQVQSLVQASGATPAS
jgi:sugar phosphate isomerase/epimerase